MLIDNYISVVITMKQIKKLIINQEITTKKDQSLNPPSILNAYPVIV